MEPKKQQASSSGFEGISDWRNIGIISAFSFVDALQFSFFVTSFWPFVQQLDSTISPTFIGIIMSLSGFGEALSAPLLGYWANRCGRVNPPLIASFCISIVANLSYLCLNAVPKEITGIALLASRFLSGAGSGNRGTFLAYTASASTKSDRTRAMALCGGGALIGLTAGPSVQVLFTWLGPQGFSLGPIRFSMFTAPALLAFIINVLCVILLKIFLDDRLDNRGKEEDTVSRITVTGADDDCTISEDLESQTEAPIRADVLAILICMLTRAARMLITANIESVGSPFSEIMFGFDETEVLRYNSLAQGGIGLLTTIMLAVYAFTNYTKWISERMNCIVAMAALLFFHLITFSYPFLPGSVECPVDANDQPLYAWCESLRPINVFLYYGSWTTIYGIFLPCLNNSLQSLYSLVLGNGRQGTMQGINQAVGSLSRIFGPLVMSTTFTSFGPQATWAVEIFTLTLFLCIWFLAYRRLVPASERRANKIAPVDHSLDLPSKSSSISL